MTARGIHYITLDPGKDDFLDLSRIVDSSVALETGFLRHIRLGRPFLLKNDGKKGRCILMETEPDSAGKKRPGFSKSF